LNKITTYFFNTQHQPKEIGWFRNALYLFLLYKVFLYLVQFNALFSDNRLVYHSVKQVNIIIDSSFFLNNHYSISLAIIFISAVAILSLIGLFKKSNYITNALLWFAVINLSNFLYPVNTGGDYLLNQLLLFNCFLLPMASNYLTINDLKTVLHNTSLLALKIQICLAYFIAAYYKITDSSWIEGIAVYQTFQVPEFSNSLFQSIPYSVCMALTYFTTIYQLSFPFLVWFRPFKIYLFSFGILQHLFIGFGMGLVSFGLVMIICYILFLKYDYLPLISQIEQNNNI